MVIHLVLSILMPSVKNKNYSLVFTEKNLINNIFNILYVYIQLAIIGPLDFDRQLEDIDQNE